MTVPVACTICAVQTEQAVIYDSQDVQIWRANVKNLLFSQRVDMRQCWEIESHVSHRVNARQHRFELEV